MTENQMDNRIGSRRKRYFAISSQIALMDNSQLVALFAASESTAGWGKNHVIDVAGSPVFIKRVPMTDREAEHPFSTKNLYDLPTNYNYGVGSAGFGVFRELIANIKTTNWVLNGQVQTFPLMYHYRILPFTGERKVVDSERHQRYVNYWGGNENISRYILDRACANHEMVLFMEYMPYVLEPYLQENPDKITSMLEELRRTIAFLRKNGIIHFDAHFHNILTDGEHPYLTDFGLVLDRSFSLTEEETAFFDAHTHYDYGEILACLEFLLNNRYEALPESEKQHLHAKYGIAEDTKRGKIMRVLIDRVEELQADGLLPLDEHSFNCLIKYRDVLTLISDFYNDLVVNPRKDTSYPQAKLQKRLKAVGFL